MSSEVTLPAFWRVLSLVTVNTVSAALWKDFALLFELALRFLALLLRIVLFIPLRIVLGGLVVEGCGVKSTNSNGS